MSPTIAEVILVEEALVEVEAEIAQANQCRIGREADAAIVADAVVLPVGVKLIEMRIGLAKRDLERVMEICNRAIAANQQPVPDHRTDLAQPYVDLVSFGALFFGRDRLGM